MKVGKGLMCAAYLKLPIELCKALGNEGKAGLDFKGEGPGSQPYPGLTQLPTQLRMRQLQQFHADSSSLIFRRWLSVSSVSSSSSGVSASSS